MNWFATHKITMNGHTYYVMENNGGGPAYTADEWAREVAADFELEDDGSPNFVDKRWLFQGAPFAGGVEKVEGEVKLFDVVTKADGKVAFGQVEAREAGEAVDRAIMGMDFFGGEVAADFEAVPCKGLSSHIMTDLEEEDHDVELIAVTYLSGRRWAVQCWIDGTYVSGEVECHGGPAQMDTAEVFQAAMDKFFCE